MAVNRIAGVMLEDNLLRDGQNLAVESSLLYVDVQNTRIGVNTFAPEFELDILGDLKVSNIVLSGHTLTNRDASGFIFDLGQSDLNVNLSNITNLQNPTALQDAATKSYVDDQVGGSVKDLIISDDSRLKITDLGSLVTLDLRANTSVATETIFTINNNSATFDTSMTVNNGLTVIGDSKIENIYFTASTISTQTTVPTDLNITSELGSVFLNGSIFHSETQAGGIMFTDGTNASVTNPNLTFDGAFMNLDGQLQVDNVIIDGNRISSTSSLEMLAQDISIVGTSSININASLDKHIMMNISGDGRVVISGTTSITIPSGTTAERPTTLEQGAMRFNQNINYPEIFNGYEWTQFSPVFTGLTFQQIVPDGVSYSYILNQDATTESVLVSLNGVLQTPITAYTVAGNTITFTDIPLTTDVISVRFMADIAEVAAITDATGTTKVEAIAGEVYIDTVGTRRFSIMGDFTEITTTIIPDANKSQNLGSQSRQFNLIHTNTTSTDFVGDNIYSVGTVIIAGGLNEVTVSTTYADPAVTGVVSFDGANTTTTLATSGKAICNVEGSVSKGDLLTSSNTSGTATVLNPVNYVPGCVIGKALQDFAGPAGPINILVSIF